MPQTKMTLEEKWKRVEENIIGIWRFRQKGKPILWAATYCFDGFYYDIYPVKNQRIALDIVFSNVQKMIKKQLKG